LERNGHKVLEAAGGAEALNIFRENMGRIGLILLDMNMPEMSGSETLTALRGISPNVPVAILSGYSEQEISTRFEGLQILQYIQKPFTAATLADSVSAILAGIERAPEQAPHATRR
jgi:DNA-binding response OmpR family regulator